MDLDLEYCNCGRYYCQFFNAARGEYGTSYTEEEVRSFLKNLPVLEEHLRKQLKLFEEDK